MFYANTCHPELFSIKGIFIEKDDHMETSAKSDSVMQLINECVPTGNDIWISFDVKTGTPFSGSMYLFSYTCQEKSFGIGVTNGGYIAPIVNGKFANTIIKKEEKWMHHDIHIDKVNKEVDVYIDNILLYTVQIDGIEETGTSIKFHSGATPQYCTAGFKNFIVTDECSTLDLVLMENEIEILDCNLTETEDGYIGQHGDNMTVKSNPTELPGYDIVDNSIYLASTTANDEKEVKATVSGNDTILQLSRFNKIDLDNTDNICKLEVL